MIILLKLIEFINNHPNWEELLQQKPYCITIKRKDNFIIFNYNQIESDFYNPIVKECRGIILENKTFKPVCVPFFKFANYGEGYADKIDWSSARVQEKVDGSLIKVWYCNGEWHVSTNGMIDAEDAPIQGCTAYSNYYDLFMEALKKYNFSFDNLNKNYTYMFELVSPYTRIVVYYPEIDIRHIGTRDNITLQELDIDIGIPKPKQYNFSSLEECVKNAKQLPFSQEGYVVVDANWHRIKVKSLAYLAVHHLKNNGQLVKARVLDLIRTNEHHEFLSYFPEYIDDFKAIEEKYNNFMRNVLKSIEEAKEIKSKVQTRKDYALWATKQIYPPILFMYYDGKIDKNNIQKYIQDMPTDKLLQLIEN